MEARDLSYYPKPWHKSAVTNRDGSNNPTEVIFYDENDNPVFRWLYTYSGGKEDTFAKEILENNKWIKTC